MVLQQLYGLYCFDIAYISAIAVSARIFLINTRIKDTTHEPALFHSFLQRVGEQKRALDQPILPLKKLHSPWGPILSLKTERVTHV